MLNEREIKNHCEKNGFGYNYFGDTAIITTGVDQWQLESVEVYNKYKKSYVDGIKLKHKNAKGNRSGKAHYHTQRYVSNIKYAFETIGRHEQNHGDYNKVFEINDIMRKNKAFI